MPSVDNLNIVISASAKEANASLNELMKTLKNLKGQLNISASNGIKITNSFTGLGNSAGRASKQFKGLASAFGRFYANYFLLIRGVKAFGRAITSTSDYLETLNFYQVALNKVGKEGEQLEGTLNKLSGLKIELFEDGTGQIVNTGVKNLGLNLEEVTQYMAKLLSVTNSLGLSAETSEASADAFAKLAGDISSLFNIDYSSAATNLQSGLTGQARALYKYGIDITNATLQTYAYEMGLKKAVSEMTQSEKMQLRMLTILDQSKVAWGDLARTIDSPSNLIRQFKNNMSELAITIGQLFIPLMSKIMPVVNGVTIALKNLMTTIAGFFGIKLNLTDAGQGFADLGEDALGLEENLEGVAEAAQKANRQLAKYDELNVISKKDTGGAGIGGIGGGIDLTEQILAATEEYNKAWEKAYAEMENKTQQFAERISSILKPIQDLFKHLSFGKWNLAGLDVSNIAVALLDTFRNAIASIPWEEVGNNIGEFLIGIEWGKIFSSLGKLIWEGINAGVDLWKGMFDAAPIETAILTGIGLLTFTPLGTMIATKLKTAFAKAFASLGTLSIFNAATVFGAGTLAEKLALILKTLTGMIGVVAGLKIAGEGFFKMWNEGFSWGEEAITLFGLALGGLSATLLGLPALTATAIVGAVAILGNSLIDLKHNYTELSDQVGKFGVDNTNQMHMTANATKQAFEDAFLWIELKLNAFVFRTKREFTAIKLHLIETFQDFKNWFINNIVNPITKALDNITKNIKNKVQSVSIASVTRNVTGFADGGFPTKGDLFIANEAGPELVGSMGTRTAVANNDQITSGIKQAAYEGMKQALSESNGLGGVSVVIEGELENLIKAFVKKNNAYRKQTGYSMF